MRVYETCSCKVIGDIELLTFSFFLFFLKAIFGISFFLWLFTESLQRTYWHVRYSGLPGRWKQMLRLF